LDGATQGLPGLLDIQGADLTVLNGAQLTLSGVTELRATNNANLYLRASDAGSVLSLPNVTQCAVNNYYHLVVAADSGARIQLPKLAAFTSGTIDAFADGDGSVIDLSGWNGPLANTSSATMYLTVANGGTILIPGVTALDRVTLTIRGTGIIPTTQLTALTGSSVVIDGAHVNFGALADTTGTTFDYRNGGTAVFLAPVDLVVSAVLAPGTAVANQPVPIVWEITNRGTGLTNGAWSDALFLSADAQPRNDELVGLFPSSATLSSGASQRYTNTLMLPAERSGSWYLVVAANQARSVFEGINTVNNTNISTTPIQILAPDLVLNSVIAQPSSAVLGQPLSVTWAVQNAGTASATGAWGDRLWLTRDPQSLASAVLLLTQPRTGDLAAGPATPTRRPSRYRSHPDWVREPTSWSPPRTETGRSPSPGKPTTPVPSR
jgi:hypothetical protein